MNILSPSILSADFKSLSTQISKLEEMGVAYLHIDVMDGNFVPNISFGMPVIKSIRENCNMIFDVHLMIDEPIRYIDDFVDAGADIITVHAEACTHLDGTLNKIKKRGIGCGVAICPATSLDTIKYVLPMLDLTLVMTVNPGFGGQKLISYTLDKVKELRKIKDEYGLKTDIAVDGGINESTLISVLNAGANVVVMGSAIFGSKMEYNTKKYLEIMKSYIYEER